MGLTLAAAAVAAAVLIGLAITVHVDALAVAAASGPLLRVIATGDALEAGTDLHVHGDTPNSTDSHFTSLLEYVRYSRKFSNINILSLNYIYVNTIIRRSIIYTFVMIALESSQTKTP